MLFVASAVANTPPAPNPLILSLSGPKAALRANDCPDKLRVVGFPLDRMAS